MRLFVLSGQRSPQRHFHSSSLCKSNQRNDGGAKAPTIPTEAPAPVSAHATKPSGLQVANVFRPGYRGIPSGIVATVFGARGHMGRYVVDTLAKNGCQVIVPFRGEAYFYRHLKVSGDLGQVVMVPYSPFDEDSCKKAMAKSNVVINLIGRQQEGPGILGDTVHTMEDYNTVLPYKLAQFANELGIERFVHLSTLNSDINSFSSWVRTKAWGENMVRQANPDATILRCGPIFGYNDWLTQEWGKRVISIPFFTPLVKKGAHKFQPVHSQDVADAVLASLLRNEAVGSTYELGGDEVWTWREFANAVYQNCYLEPDIYDCDPETVAWINKEYYRKFFCDFVSKTDVELMMIDRLVDNHSATKTFQHLGIENPTSLHKKLPGLLEAFIREGRGPDSEEGVAIDTVTQNTVAVVEKVTNGKSRLVWRVEHYAKIDAAYEQEYAKYENMLENAKEPAKELSPAQFFEDYMDERINNATIPFTLDQGSMGSAEAELANLTLDSYDLYDAHLRLQSESTH